MQLTISPAKYGQALRLLHLILDGTISPQDYQDMKGKIDKDLVLFNSKLSGLTDKPSPYKTYISKTVPMLENLTGYYKAADGQTKKKILGCIFSEKLVFEKVLLRYLLR
jgi:site-specific DNA recombinase